MNTLKKLKKQARLMQGHARPWRVCRCGCRLGNNMNASWGGNYFGFM